MEEWRASNKFKRIQVSNQGRVKTVWDHKETVLKPMIAPTSKGHYLKVSVTPIEGGGQRQVLVHTLVAEAFVDKPNPVPNGLEVNHRDGDKTNNAAYNLEWLTHSENMKHSFTNGLRNSHRGKNNSRAIKVQAVDKNTGAVTSADTIQELADKIGVERSFISRRLKNPELNSRNSDIPFKI